MSKLSDLDLQLQEIRAIMDEPASTPTLNVERKLALLLSDADDIAALAADPTMIDLIAAQEKTVGIILSRIELVLSFIDSNKPPELQQNPPRPKRLRAVG